MPLQDVTDSIAPYNEPASGAAALEWPAPDPTAPIDNAGSGAGGIEPFFAIVVAASGVVLVPSAIVAAAGGVALVTGASGVVVEPLAL